MNKYYCSTANWLLLNTVMETLIIIGRLNVIKVLRLSQISNSYSEIIFFIKEIRGRKKEILLETRTLE